MASAEDADEDGSARIHRLLIQESFAAYHADDLDRLRSQYAPDFAGFDHRLVGLGPFDLEQLLAYLGGLFAHVRSHRSTVLWDESRGGVSIMSAVEVVETLDGSVVSMPLIVVSVIVDGKIGFCHLFDPVQETDARAKFEDLAETAEEAQS